MLMDVDPMEWSCFSTSRRRSSLTITHSFTKKSISEENIWFVESTTKNMDPVLVKIKSTNNNLKLQAHVLLLVNACSFPKFVGDKCSVGRTSQQK